MMRFNRIFIGLVSLGAVFGAGCESIKCGVGTVEQNGVCVATTVVTAMPTCSPGTHLEGSVCVPDQVCGTDGSNTRPSDGGVCQGVGGGTDTGSGCRSALPCPPQSGGKYCVTGRVTLFKEDALPLFKENAMPGETRTVVTGERGICVSIYSPTDFVAGIRQPLGNPMSAQLDECGRFVIQDVPVTSTMFVAAAADDCGEMPGTMLTGTWTFMAVGGQQIAGSSTIDLSSSQTSLTAIETTDARMLVEQARGKPNHDDIYGQGGAYIMIFRDSRTTAFPPVQGVVPVSPGADYINESNTFYFGADLLTLDLTRTYSMGTNAATGAALINPPQVQQHAGMGGTPALTWETILGGSADGALFVQRWRLAQ